MSAEEVQISNPRQHFASKVSGAPQIATPGGTGNESSSEEFWFKNYRTPSASIAGFGFGKGEGVNANSSYIEVDTAPNNIYESSLGMNSTVLPRHIVDNNPLHTGGICSMIVF